MSELATVLVLSYAAGLAMPVGAAIARRENIAPGWLAKDFRHGMIAFGGGALLAAVALILVPEGIRHFSPVWAAIWIFTGALSLLSLDLFLAKKRSQAGQLAAMLTDFIPESLALGASFATGGNSGYVIALMIGLQNLPEGFNAFRELTSATRFSKRRLIVVFILMASLGPLSSWIGFAALSHQVAMIGAIELFAAGGILYLIFQDIAPQARLKEHWVPPLGAVAGFLLGLIGHMLAGGG